MVTLPPPVIIFVEEPAQFEIRDGIACGTVRSGDYVIEVRCRPRVLAASVINATGALAEHGDQSAQIVRLTERGPMFLVERHD